MLMNGLLKQGLNEELRTDLYDGRSVKNSIRKLLVGYIYMLKLSHLVMIRFMQGQSDHTHLLLSSHSAEKLSSADRDSEKWKSGLLKVTAPLISFRKF